MRVQAEDLVLDPSEGARRVCRALLAEAESELDGLESGEREEALHDFRVAVRRLRSLLRSLRPWLAERVPRRRERRLREIASATSGARDAEVQLAWLKGMREDLSPREAKAAEWIAARLSVRQLSSAGEGTGALADRFRHLSGRLERNLEPHAEEQAHGDGPTFGAVLAMVIVAEARVLLGGLETVAGPQDVAHAHATRIAGKRLRYLLEPLRGARGADSNQAVQVLKELQDLLGELHDAHVLGDALAEGLEALASDRARRAHAAVLAGRPIPEVLRLASRDDLLAGLLLLDRRAAERVAAAFTSLLNDWLPTRRAALVRAVSAAVEGLSPGAPGRVEAGRKFLLLHLPEEARELEALDLQEGWLPGPPPRTWMLRVAGPDRIRHFKGLGNGLDREEITAVQFEALWPQAGSRISRRRRLLDRGRQRWVIDEVGERAVVLAESCAPPGVELRIPGWLRPVLVREVTDERAYQDELLVARTRREPPAPTPADGA